MLVTSILRAVTAALDAVTAARERAARRHIALYRPDVAERLRGRNSATTPSKGK